MTTTATSTTTTPTAAAPGTATARVTTAPVIDRGIFSYRVNDFATPSGWDTSNLFDNRFIEPNQSPIDTFYQKITELNKLILDPRDTIRYINSLKASGNISQRAFDRITNNLNETTTIPPVHANLILLGYVSAVESYFREILRKIILIDEVSRKNCEMSLIAFGGALYHQKDLLPETLLEKVSFIKVDSFKSAFKDFIAIASDKIPSSLEASLKEFENVCQLRHCIVHRYGKLGANNAMKLGLDFHAKFIEKPIKLDFNSINVIAIITRNIVNEINQFLWQYIMMRQIAEPFSNGIWKRKTSPIEWTWVYKTDKKRFKVFFDTFITQNRITSTTLSQAYNEFKTRFNTLPA